MHKDSSPDKEMGRELRRPPGSGNAHAGPDAHWKRLLLSLAGDLRQTATTWKASRTEGVQPVAQGVGDVSFAPDRATENLLSRWLRERAGEGPLSLLTEDQGWRHWGPGAEPGSIEEFDGFDHGGPRITIDPIDGTRPWLHGLRPAWVVIAYAPAGPERPTFSEVTWACVEEIPLPLAGWARRLTAEKGHGCSLDEIPLLDQAPGVGRKVHCVDEGQLDHGFVSFFAFHPSVRARIDDFANHFLTKVAHEQALEIEHCYDDQYIASGGQLALLALGHYRMLCDPRPALPDPNGEVTQCAKPYDVAGAALCALEAGCILLDLEGMPFDPPLDATTDVGFVAYPGPKSWKRFQTAWLETRAQLFPR